MDGAFQIQVGADFHKGQIRLLLQEKAHFPAMGIKDDGLPTAQMMARGDVSLVGPLLEEFLDHAKGHFKPLGNLVPGDIPLIVCLENPLPQIHGERGHTESVAWNPRMDIKLFKML